MATITIAIKITESKLENGVEVHTSLHEFSEGEKKGVYRSIYERRDIRKEFLPHPIPRNLLVKLLDAVHHAGSVGFMQPWNFIVIDDDLIKQEVKAVFERENIIAAQNYEDEQKEKYLSLKLEGILEAPLNVCVTCDRLRGGPHVLGRNTIPETDLFSTCCAIQNLWLTARAEGIGIGWVSILNQDSLRKILGIPETVIPIAYLCLGYVSNFPKRPMLEEAGWAKRIPMEQLIFRNGWNQK